MGVTDVGLKVKPPSCLHF